MDIYPSQSFRPGQTVYVLDGLNIISATLHQINEWTEELAAQNPGMSIAVGGMLFIVKLDDLAGASSHLTGVSGHQVFPDYAAASDAWDIARAQVKNPAPPIYRSRSRREQLIWN